MKVAVIVFPGSNCDHDLYTVFRKVLDIDTDFVWHKETDLTQYDIITQYLTREKRSVFDMINRKISTISAVLIFFTGSILLNLYCASEAVKNTGLLIKTKK